MSQSPQIGSWFQFPEEGRAFVEREILSQSPQIGSWFQFSSHRRERHSWSLNPLRSGLGFNQVGDVILL